MATVSEYPSGTGPTPRDATDANVILEHRGSAAWPTQVRSALRKLGPGLVTGASDDDPSGIATYSQVGAQFGYGMLWTMLVSYPLMGAIQEICARVGRVTGSGIAANLRKCYPVWLLYLVVALMLLANIFNLGADIGAMGAAAQLLVPGRTWLYVLLFGVASLLLQMFVPYSSYVKYLKWLTKVADSFTLRLRCGSFLCPTIVATGAPRDDLPPSDVEHRVFDRSGRSTRNYHQPIPLLLAGLSGG